MDKAFIEREAALNKLLQYADQVDYTNTLGAMIGVILRDIPAADARPVVRGRWVKSKMSAWGYRQWYECSECGEPVFPSYGHPARTNFCHNCGADMRETEPQKCDTCSHGAHWDGVVICDRDGQRHERNETCKEG